MYLTPAEIAASQAANQYTSQPAPQAASNLPTATNTQAGTQAIKDYVSQVMGMGGISDEQKSQMIRSQAYATGTTPEQIAAATGYGLDNVNAYLGLSKSPAAPTPEQIAAAEQQARQVHMDMGMAGRQQTLDPETLRTLFSINAQGQVVRNSDQYAAPFSFNQIANPNAREYYAQNPQELFALGALGGGGGQGYFMDAGVRGTDKKMGQLTPDQWYQGYTSNFQDNWMDNLDPNYRYAAQRSGTGTTGSSTGGNPVSTVDGLMSQYINPPTTKTTIPVSAPITASDVNKASAGGNSGDYNTQLQEYYRAYFGGDTSPNMGMLSSWYGGGYSPTPTGFSKTAPGASAAKTIVQALNWNGVDNFKSSLKKLSEYSQLYGLSLEDIAAGVGSTPDVVSAEFTKYGIPLPSSSKKKEASATPSNGSSADSINPTGNFA